MKKRVELLAPAGNYEAFLGAVNAGADAVYLGGEKFGARAYADNFTAEEICRAVHVAHFMGRKVYLTVNTLMKDEELEELVSFLKPFYEAGRGHRTGYRGALPYQSFSSGPCSSRQHADDADGAGGMYVSEGTGGGACCACKRTVAGRNSGDQGEDRPGDRVFYSWSYVLLLFRPMPFQQPSGREKREQRKVCTALQASLPDPGRREGNFRCELSVKPEGYVYHNIYTGAD